MRIVILSDTHGLVDSRIAALAHEADLVVHAGDIGNAHVLETLHDDATRIIAVRGNNDVAAKWPREDVAMLKALREREIVDLPGGSLVVTHGDTLAPSTRHAKLRAAFADAKAIVYGHSHRALIDDAITPWVMNAGAAGRARTHGGPSCIVLDASPRRWNAEIVRFPLSAR